MKIEIQQRILSVFVIQLFHFTTKKADIHANTIKIVLTYVTENSLKKKKDTKDEMKYGLQKIE